MRTGRAVILAFSLLSAIFPSLSAVANQTFTVDPENPPAEIRVQGEAEFTLILRYKGWYLNRYDRSRLLFKSRIVDSDRTIFIMQPSASGDAYMVLSFRDTHIELVVRIGDSVTAVEETTSESTAQEEESTRGKLVEERVKALRERVTTADVGPEKERETETAGAVQEAVDGKPEQAAEKAEPLRERVEKEDAPAIEDDSDLKTAMAPVKQRETGEGELYYVDESNSIVKVPRVDEEDYYRRGKRFFRNGQYDQAETELGRYLASCEKCASGSNARLLLADIALQAGREEDGLAFLDAVIAEGRGPQESQALERRAEVHYHSGRFIDAAQDYERLYQSDGPSSAGVARRLGDIYFKLNEQEQALHWYEEGIARGGADDEVVFRIATICDSPGATRDIEKAYHYYRIITDEHTSSVYFERARERVRFYEKNFFNYQ